MIVLQWNARSLLSNGQEFKGFIQGLADRPDVMCVEETWLRPALDFAVEGYDCVRRDREGGSGGGGVLLLLGREYRIELLRLGRSWSM